MKQNSLKSKFSDSINHPKLYMAAVIWALAWPTMLEQLMQTAVQYVDTAMVGTLGTQATAAVGSTTTVNWLIGSTISALSVGFLSFIARAYGANDKKAASKASAQAVFIVLVSGILFTIATLALSGMIPVWMQVDPAIRDIASKYFFILYIPMLPRAATIIFGTVLRAAGDTKSPMKIGILVNVVNIVLNYFLIYPTRTVTIGSLSFPMIGAGWGVLGAAAADDVTLAAIALIDSLPETVSLEDRALVEEARAAYDAISTIEQRALVTNYSKLTEAEDRIEKLLALENPEDTTPPADDEVQEDGKLRTIILIALASALVAAAVCIIIIDSIRVRKEKLNS